MHKTNWLFIQWDIGSLEFLHMVFYDCTEDEAIEKSNDYIKSFVERRKEELEEEEDHDCMLTKQYKRNFIPFKYGCVEYELRTLEEY